MITRRKRAGNVILTASICNPKRERGKWWSHSSRFGLRKTNGIMAFRRHVVMSHTRQLDRSVALRSVQATAQQLAVNQGRRRPQAANRIQIRQIGLRECPLSGDERQIVGLT